MGTTGDVANGDPWNEGKIVGQKAPFKLKDIWALRVRLQMENRVLFNLGIDSKLRGYDLVALRVRDVCHRDQVASRAIILQHKTQRPVQFEITQATREALQAWIKQTGLESEDFLFPSRLHGSPHLGTLREVSGFATVHRTHGSTSERQRASEAASQWVALLVTEAPEPNLGNLGLLFPRRFTFISTLLRP